MKKSIFDSSGFSLVEVIIAAGLTSVLGFLIMNMMIKANRTATDLDANTDASTTFNQIRLLLNNRTACENTFKNILNLTGTSSTSSVAISEIKNTNNATVYRSSGVTGVPSYGKNISIHSMFAYRTSGVNGSISSVNLRLNFYILTGTKKGKQVNKDLVFMADTASSTGLVSTCFADVDNAILQTCTQVGGVLNVGTASCDLTPYNSSATTTPPTVTSSSVSTDYLYKFIQDLALPTTYVKRSGDIMTGALINSATGTAIAISNNATVGAAVTVSGSLNVTGSAPISNFLRVGTLNAGYGIMYDDTVGSPFFTAPGDLNFATHKYVYKILTTTSALTAPQLNLIATQALSATTSITGYPTLRNTLRSSIGNSTCTSPDKISGLTCTSSGCVATCTTDSNNQESISITTTSGCSAPGAQKAITSFGITGTGLTFTATCSSVTVPTVP